mmetsp:Transcript_28091/g.57962  ORF Transcript_28091/g.57962 Transcript_28091/m.57962 type:complete len:305 (-) Transcript_28091:56-970(-)
MSLKHQNRPSSVHNQKLPSCNSSMGRNCSVSRTSNGNRQITFFVPSDDFVLFGKPFGGWKMIRHIGVQTGLCCLVTSTHSRPQSSRIKIRFTRGKHPLISRTRTRSFFVLLQSLLHLGVILWQQLQFDLFQVIHGSCRVRSVPPSRIPFVIRHIVRILPGIPKRRIRRPQLHRRLRSRTGMTELNLQIGILVRNLQGGIRTGHLLHPQIVVGTVQNQFAEFFVLFVTEFVFEEGGEPAVPRHHSFFGGGGGGGFGEGGVGEVGAGYGPGGDVGGVLFEAGGGTEDGGGADHDRCLLPFEGGRGA